MPQSQSEHLLSVAKSLIECEHAGHCARLVEIAEQAQRAIIELRILLGEIEALVSHRQGLL
jgi:hypothetical protein